MVGAVHGQTVSPVDEYRKLIAAGQSIQPQGMHPFGESINLYNGSLSFEVTDISVPGTGPTLQLSRSLDAAESGENQYFNMQRPFGDWDLDIPRMETMSALQTNVEGWWVGAGTRNRCTNFSAPPPVQALQSNLFDWQPNQWWYGYHLIIPGNGNQYVGWGGGSDLTPSVSGLTFPLGTKQDWRIACGVTASDGGEGFLAIAPDGTRYTFAYLVYRPAQFVNRTTNLSTTDALERRDAFMYVTKVQDRFGNTLTYNWSGNNLGSIVASDGRELDFAYYTGTPLIHTITLEAAGGAIVRTWTYIYNTSGSDPSLTQVQLPDGSAWAYQMGDLQSASLTTQGVNCPNDTPISINAGAATGSMTTPSGLTAAFTLTPMLHGRSYVPKQCLGAPSGSPGSYPAIPNVYAQYSLTKEVLTGPGIPSGGWTWNWSYSAQTALNASWTTDACDAAGNCPDRVYTDAQDPLGQVTRYTYSNRFDITEGQLLQVDKYSGAANTTGLESVVNTYADSSNGSSWPVAGDTKMNRINRPQIEDTAPLQSRIVTLPQQSASFSTNVTQFDNLARAIQETEASSLGYSKTDTTSYQDDTTNWVLGLVVHTTTNSISVTDRAYDSLDRLQNESSFGRLVSTYTWNSDGTLHTIEDGDSRTTTLSSWYRGVPQNIAYADGTSQSATVDGNGWITSVTDENRFTTIYGHDAMGRISNIAYPGGDDVAWNQTQLSFVPVGSIEYGIAAGHWKQTVHTGNDYAVTYFDAFWRPLVTEHYDSGNRSGTLSQTVEQYDADGNRVFASYATNTASSYTQALPGTHTLYDALDRVTEVDADSELGTLRTVTQYLSGFQAQVTDPRGYVSKTSYQAYGEPDTSYPVSIVMPEGETTTIMRDVFGKPQSITRSGSGWPSVTRNYAYNGYQELCGLTEPETNTTAYGYDPAGNLSWSAPGMPALIGSCYAESQASGAGREVPRTYDGRNRLSTVTYPDGSSSLSFGYYPDGLLDWQTDNNGGNPVTTTYGYDKRRLLISEVLNVSGTWSATLGYFYDANGHLLTTTYPDKRSVGYAPNALGQPTEAGSYATGAIYYPDGAVESYTYGNGLVHSMTENTRELPGRVTDAYGATSVQDSVYSYDGDGDVKAITDYTAGSVGSIGNMTYDGLDRVTEADSPMFGGDGKAVYGYDTLDNLQSARVGGGTSYGYAYDTANRLHQLTNAANGAVVNTYVYDVQGNLANKNGQAYQFDMANRLRDAPGLGSYLYDAAGRRVQKTETGNGRRLYSMYSKAGQLIFQWDPATQNVADYIYLGDSLVARVISSQTAVTLSMSSSVINVTSGGANLTVNLSNPSATGTVTFTENGTVLGSAAVSNGKASIVLQGLSYGVHSITVSYPGDSTNGGQTTVFTVRVQNLGWLPAVLNLLLQ